MAPALSPTMPRSCGSPPSERDQCREPDGVGGDDLVRPRRRPGRHELVAGRDERDARAAAHRHGAIAHGRRERHLAVAEPGAGGEEDGALLEVETGGADVPAGQSGLADADRAVGKRLGVLLDQDRVGALRHRRAGEDADGFAGRHFAGKGTPGSRHADDLDRGAKGGIGGAKRIAVHGGSREGRLGALSRQIFGEHAAGRFRQRYCFGGEWRDAGDDAGDRFGDGEQAHFAGRPSRSPSGRHASREGGCR